MSLPEPMALRARPVRLPRLDALYRGLLGSWGNAALTLAVLAALAWLLPPLVRWAVLDATWSGDAAACAAGEGACWAFVGAKLRFILFAFYPPAEHWRPAVALAIGIALVVVTATPRFWSAWLIPLWIAALAFIWPLMSGSLAPPRISSDQWGGLVLTLLVSITAFAGAFPLGMLLALGRRARLPAVRWVAVAYIELMRAVPMIAVLYFAMLVMPMGLPDGALLPKLVRAQIGLTLFIAAYMAEIIRAGLQALPAGQYEAAASLGFGYWGAMRMVVLPQALRAVIPALVNLAIGLLQNSSLIAVIGLFDLLNTAKAAATDPAWYGFYDEGYALAAIIFFALSFGASQYSLWLQRVLGTGTRRGQGVGEHGNPHDQR